MSHFWGQKIQILTVRSENKKPFFEKNGFLFSDLTGIGTHFWAKNGSFLGAKHTDPTRKI